MRLRASRLAWSVVVPLLSGAAALACSSSSAPATVPAADGGRDSGPARDARAPVDSRAADARADRGGDAPADAPGDARADAGCPLSPTCHACLATDPANCGACGNSCGAGGVCEEGACSRVLATGQGSAPGAVQDLIVDTGRVYWIPGAGAASGGTVLAVPKAGGAVATLATGISQPEGLAQDDANLYFVSHDVGVERVAKTGGSKALLLEDGTLDGGVFPEFWLVVASPNLYYVGGQGTGLYGLPLEGGGTPTPVAGASGLLGAPGTGYFAAAVDDTGIYYDTTSQIVTVDRATGLQVATVPGSSPTAGFRFGPTLAVDATSLYFISNTPADGGTASSVMSAPKNGGAAKIIASGPVAFDDGPVAVDGTSVYWSHLADAAAGVGAVVAAPLAGGSVVTVATGCTAHCAFAVDATSIYWAAADGTIRAAPRAP